MSELIKISDIKVLESFVMSKPKQEKIQLRREYLRTFDVQVGEIILDEKNILMDGYAQLLVLYESGVEYAYVSKIKREDSKKMHIFTSRPRVLAYDEWKHRVRGIKKEKKTYKNTPTLYVYGVHQNDNDINGKYGKKQYVWRIPNKWNYNESSISIGDIVLCDTKYGKKTVLVTDIKMLSVNPIDFPVKKVRQVVRRNLMSSTKNDTQKTAKWLPFYRNNTLYGRNYQTRIGWMCSSCGKLQNYCDNYCGGCGTKMYE